MARGINKVILLGHLGQDPDVRLMPNGNSVANLTIATSESWKDKQTGQQQDRTEWHRVVIFGKLAEIAGQYLRKGSLVYIEGQLQTRKWQDKNGQDRYTTEVVVNMTGTLQMLDRKGSNEGGNSDHSGFNQSAPQNNFSQQSDSGFNSQAKSSQSSNTAMPSFDDFDDDIPF